MGENGIDDIFISIEEAKDFGTWKVTMYGPRSLGASLDERNEFTCSRGFHNIRSPFWKMFCSCARFVRTARNESW